MIVYRELSSIEADLGIPAKTLYVPDEALKWGQRTLKETNKEGLL